MSGPGRFVIFSTGHEAKPFLSVYPDSDKISGPGGVLLRTSAVGYWHGEGTAGASGPVAVVREPETAPPRPVVSVPALPREAGLGALLGAERLDAAVADLDPYHYTYGREEWLLVLAGAATLRRPEGERRLAAGDLVCFPEGPAGAHGLTNHDNSPVRALLLTTTGLPANVYHPDTGRWLLRNGPGDAVEVTPAATARPDCPPDR